MSKPPFIISNRAGPELWPRSIQLPTTTTITYEGIGETAEERAAALEFARGWYEKNQGAIKQYYLRQRNASDGGVSTYMHHSMKLMPGINVRYERNFQQERLHIDVSATATIRYEEEKKVPQLLDELVLVIFYEWNSGLDLDTLTAITDPPRSQYVGWAAGRDAQGTRTGIYDEGTPSMISVGGKRVMTWATGDNTGRTGPEIVIVTPTPLFELGYTSITLELNANWYAEQGNFVYVVAQVYQNPAKADVFDLPMVAPDQARSFLEAKGLELLEEQEFIQGVDVYSQAKPVQRVGYVTLSVRPPAPNGVDQGYTLKAESEPGTIIFSP